MEAMQARANRDRAAAKNTPGWSVPQASGCVGIATAPPSARSRPSIHGADSAGGARSEGGAAPRRGSGDGGNTRTSPRRSRSCDSKQCDEHAWPCSSPREMFVHRLSKRSTPSSTRSLVGEDERVDFISFEEVAITPEAVGEPPETPGYRLAFNEECGLIARSPCVHTSRSTLRRRFAKHSVGVVQRRGRERLIVANADRRRDDERIPEAADRVAWVAGARDLRRQGAVVLAGDWNICLDPSWKGQGSSLNTSACVRLVGSIASGVGARGIHPTTLRSHYKRIDGFFTSETPWEVRS